MTRTLVTTLLLLGALAAGGCGSCDGGGDDGGSAGGSGGSGGRGGDGGATFGLRLDVTAVSPATGVLRWRVGAGGASCATSCQYPVAAGATVHLVAAPSTLAGVQRWSGDCADAGSGTECTLVMSSNRAAGVALTPYNVVFATSVTVAPGALGGLGGADALCRSLAAAAGLPGEFIAGLSTAAEGLAGRIPASARGWVRPDGLPFTDTAASLFGRGEVFYPPRLSEQGLDLYTFGKDVVVVTGTGVDGQPKLEQCFGYTDGGAGGSVTSGLASAGAGTWSDDAVWPCSDPARIYCLGISFSAPAVPARDPANRLAFLSRQAFVPQGGLAAADAQCQADALDAGLRGTFDALLASGTSQPSARFSTAGAPWQLPNGVLLAPTAAIYFSVDYSARMSGVTTFADGTYAAGNYAYWTGTSTTISLPVFTCGDWTTASSAAIGMSMEKASLSGGFYLVPRSTPCSATDKHLICMQQ